MHDAFCSQQLPVGLLEIMTRRRGRVLGSQYDLCNNLTLRTPVAVVERGKSDEGAPLALVYCMQSCKHSFLGVEFNIHSKHCQRLDLPSNEDCLFAVLRGPRFQACIAAGPIPIRTFSIEYRAKSVSGGQPFKTLLSAQVCQPPHFGPDHQSKCPGKTPRWQRLILEVILGYVASVIMRLQATVNGH